MSALKTQIGGDHYKDKGIQPVEIWHRNKLDAFQGALVKYILRWRDKGGIEDLEKCKHILELYIEFEKEELNTQREKFVGTEKDHPKDPSNIPEFDGLFNKSMELRSAEKKPLGYYLGRPFFSFSEIPPSAREFF